MQIQSSNSQPTVDSPRRYWRSLSERDGDEQVQHYLARVEAAADAHWSKGSRRDFLRLLGASLALAGVNGCVQQPEEKIVPYVRQPEEIVPGQPLYFATAMTLGGSATGLLVESHMGRPTKIEGNPRHPSVPATYWTGDPQLAPGVSDAFAQAEILTMYDPNRSQAVTRAGEISTWSAFISALRPRLEAQRAVQGRGIRLLTETVTSPTLADQIRRFLEEYPEAEWIQYEPVNSDNALAGSQLAFGRYATPHYDLERADVILALDADFLVEGPDHLRHAHAFANRRDIASGKKMNRLYAMESTPTLTGAKADHRLTVAATEIESFTFALAARLGIDVPDPAESLSGDAQRWLTAAADDLRRRSRQDGSGAGLVIAGRWLSPQVQAVVHAMNDAIGAPGETVSYTEPAVAEPTLQYPSLQQLVDDMQAGQVEMLFILGGNPVYTAPGNLDFADALAKVSFRARLGLYEDETSALCDWHIPQAHFLEAWDDARAHDGTVSIVQPLIAPLYQGRTVCELMAALMGQPGRRAHDMVKSYWQGNLNTTDDFETAWETALHEGIVPGTKTQALSVAADLSNLEASPSDLSSGKTSREDNRSQHVELVFRPDPTICDGRFANNGWLQELPKPLTKLTWDNAALISPRMAERLGLVDGDLVRIEHDEKSVVAPIWRIPGQPEHSVTLHLGYGRTRAGRVGSGLGYDAYALQSTASPWHAHLATLRRLGKTVELACTQEHHGMQGRDLVRVGTVDEVRKNPQHPAFMKEQPAELPSLYPEYEYDGHKWGMNIDLGRCTGCNACVVACQSENNIPVVGKQQVAMGREMHWIRIDSYYEGPVSNPRVVHQPLPCMHCEMAPCEVVCPVGATVHDEEGLNEMVYNRCVGTRYCSNNCPYKVRRFNFLQYSELGEPTLKMMHNPDVTVRNRGVMEKCTYCVQRIAAARIDADKGSGKIKDGSLVTACQAACPAQAITFGDLNEPESRVRTLAESPLNYALLAELNTRPRTTFQAAVRNPNPELATREAEDPS